ncbi:MAG: hypothetical protein P4L83_16205 [Nevskia sp.]|nr:hypothetical protein [Nevskia sp.]
MSSQDPLSSGRYAATQYGVSGDLQLVNGEIVEGWVWTPAQPERRLVAEVLVDDALAGAVVAVQPRPDLLARGIGDGRYGFRLRLPPRILPAEGPVVITGRERQSAQVFGRTILRPGELTADYRVALGTVVDEVGKLHAAVARTLRDGPDPATQARQLRAACAGLAEILAARVRGGAGTAAIDTSLARLRRRAPVLPRLAVPALSLVLPGLGSAFDMLRRIGALAPALAAAEAELILLDAGADPASLLLPAAVANLVYLRESHADDALAAAGRLARGRAVAFLEAGPTAPSATALLELAVLLGRPAPVVWLGPATLAACYRVGAPVAAMATHHACARLGLRAALPTALLRAAGGVETAPADGAGLACADLWLRCRLLGAGSAVWTEPDGDVAPAGIASPSNPRAALAALAAFRNRWHFQPEVAHG